MKCSVCKKDIPKLSFMGRSQDVIGLTFRKDVKSEAGLKLGEAYKRHEKDRYDVCMDCWMTGLGIKEEK